MTTITFDNANDLVGTTFGIRKGPQLDANIAAVSVKSDKLAAVLIALYSNHATVLKGATYTGF